jgi:CRP/FNR family transcriptional regulator, cyclic AMP receptor protein
LALVCRDCGFRRGAFQKPSDASLANLGELTLAPRAKRIPETDVFTIVDEQGKEAAITLLEVGDFVGDSYVSNGSPLRITSASAIKPTTLVVIPKKQMQQALHRDEAFADRFIAYMLKRNLKVESDLVDQLFNSTEKRLARALLLLAQYGQDGKPETTVGNISQELWRNW